MRLYKDICQGACATVSAMVLGQLQNNVYIIENPADPADCFVVDPSCQVEVILEALDGRKPAAIVCTHYHYDHTGAAAALRAATGAPVLASAADADIIEGKVQLKGRFPQCAPCTVDVRVQDGDVFAFAGVEWKAIMTPGHSPGSMCLYAEAGQNPYGLLVAGDTLFAGCIGRVDFADGSMPHMLQSLTILSELPDNTIVLPGHDSLCTIADNRRPVFNRYLGTR